MDKKDLYKRSRAAKSIENFKPKLLGASDNYQAREALEEVLPEGTSLGDMPRNASSGYFGNIPWLGGSTGSGGNGSSMFHAQRPYLPEYESPDRYYFPTNRKEANRYWRFFYKMDPMFGTAIEMYSQMMFGSYDVIVDNDKDKGIRNALQGMCEQVRLLDNLQALVREFLVVGEAFPHMYFDKESGLWSHMSFADADNIEVLDAPFIKSDPILNFIPDQDMIDLFSDSSLETRELQKKFPSEFVTKVRSNQKIRLSNKHFSFIPRKLHPYDVRGTSIASRLWRIWMVEDAVYAATIAIFRRQAAPLRVLKLGDPNSGYVPSPDREAKLLQMIAQAESDPNATLVWDYAINFETWGDPGRAINIGREHDTIEKVKLVALGLSKSFLHGETTFSSSKAGLQVFLRRLLSLRQFFESVWIYPKFFQPIVEANQWYKSTPPEVAHNYRIKRTAQELREKDLLIRPKIKWRNNLDPRVDSDLLNALGQLKNMGFPVSDGTLGSAVSVDFDEEVKNKALEWKRERELVKETLGETYYAQYKQEEEAANQPAGKKPQGAPGSGAVPVSTSKEPIHVEGNPPGSGDTTLGDNTPLADNIDQGITKGM